MLVCQSSLTNPFATRGCSDIIIYDEVLGAKMDSQDNERDEDIDLKAWLVRRLTPESMEVTSTATNTARWQSSQRRQRNAGARHSLSRPLQHSGPQPTQGTRHASHDNSSLSYKIQILSVKPFLFSASYSDQVWLHLFYIGTFHLWQP